MNRHLIHSLQLYKKRWLFLLFPFLICLTFFTAYSVLSIVRHNHYQSFGYDLGINDQTVWRYSHFQAPITTIDPFPDKTKLVLHVELIYALIAPFYWIWETRRMLLLVEAAVICFSGIPVYLLARKKGLKNIVSIPLLISYLAFYGVQGVMWFDTHSISYGAAFLMWFIYFLETKKNIPAVIFFLLAITAKENVGLITFLIGFVYFLKERRKVVLFFMAMSFVYVTFIFFIYFPYIVHMNYLYANSGGLFSNLNPISLADTTEKQQVLWYSLLSFGFLPLLSPLYLIPAIGDLSTYFVIANQLSGAQGLFGQYRVTLAPLLMWSTIISLSKYKKLNTWYIGVYIILCTMLVQFFLHLPLSYLTKQWFWAQPSGVNNINSVIRKYLPTNASVVSQNNITPHLSHRDQIYTLYPEKKLFQKHSPCGETMCDWFRWYGSPEFMIVDTSVDWDSRHLLTNRDEYIRGLQNIERAKVVQKYQQIGSAILYKVNFNPDKYQ
jgi:uncharacterized membrane protein